MAANADNAERLAITTQRFFHGHPGPGDQLESLYRAAVEVGFHNRTGEPGISGNQHMNLDLTGKIALVTGSTRGIGLASAAGLAQMGAEVIVNGREAAAVADAIARIKQAAPGANAHAAVFDLGGAKGCAGLVARFPRSTFSSTISGSTSRRPFSISRMMTGPGCSRSTS